jgi:ferredoxin
MRVIVDRSRCIGASICMVAAPDVFMLDGGRKAFVMNPRGADADTLRRAAASCPTGAISVTEEEEKGGPGRPLPPDSAG